MDDIGNRARRWRSDWSDWYGRPYFVGDVWRVWLYWAAGGLLGLSVLLELVVGHGWYNDALFAAGFVLLQFSFLYRRRDDLYRKRVARLQSAQSEARAAAFAAPGVRAGDLAESWSEKRVPARFAKEHEQLLQLASTHAVPSEWSEYPSYIRATKSAWQQRSAIERELAEQASTERERSYVEALSGTDAAIKRAFAKAYENVERSLADLLAGLEALEPPSRLREIHDRLVTAYREYRDANAAVDRAALEQGGVEKAAAAAERLAVAARSVTSVANELFWEGPGRGRPLGERP